MADLTWVHSDLQHLTIFQQLYKGSGASTSTIAHFYPSDFVVTHDWRRITYRAHLALRAHTREGVHIVC